MKRIKIGGITLLFVMIGALTSFAQGWQVSDGSWKYEKADGTMASQEWIQDNGMWYYLDESGIWNPDAPEAAGGQTEDAAEEERYQQWRQSIQDGEPKEMIN